MDNDSSLQANESGVEKTPLSDVVNLQKDLDLVLPVDEKASNYLKVRVLDAIDRNLPIFFPVASKHLGDNFIKYDSIVRVLESLASQNGITSNPRALLSPIYSALDFYKNGLGMIKVDPYLEYVYNYPQAYMVWVARSLGMDLTTLDSRSIPIPRHFDVYPMNGFNEELVNEQVDLLKTIIDPNIPAFVISHGGSKAIKRFNDSQINYISYILSQHFPEKQIVILSADKIDKRIDHGNYDVIENAAPIFSGANLLMHAADNINSTVALFRMLKDVTFISTDSFLAWLGSGAIASRKDRTGVLRQNDVFDLYTIASPDYWKINGVNVSTSKALRSNASLLRNGTNMISDEAYLSYFEYNSILQSGKSQTQISDEDVEAFLHDILNKLNA